MKPTFIDRNNTNERVLQKVKEVVKDDGSMLGKRVSEILKLKRMLLMSHIIRADSDDPMKQVTFGDKEHLTRKTKHYKRVGAPRKKWIDETMKDLWNKCRVDDNEQYNPGNQATRNQQHTLIKTYAQNRI